MSFACAQKYNKMSNILTILLKETSPSGLLHIVWTDFLTLRLFCFNIRQHGRQILYFKLHVNGRKFHYRKLHAAVRPKVVHRWTKQTAFLTKQTAILRLALRRLPIYCQALIGSIQCCWIQTKHRHVGATADSEAEIPQCLAVTGNELRFNVIEKINFKSECPVKLYLPFHATTCSFVCD